MKEKIIAHYKALFPAVNLSKKRLDAIADKLEKKITDENDIDAKLNELNELLPFADIARDDDKIRDLEAKTKKGVPTNSDDKTPDNKDQKKDEPQDDTPAWAKALIEQNKLLADKVAGIEKEKTVGSIKQKATEKLKDIPAAFWGKRPIPEKEEELETFITDVTTDYDAFKQDLVNQGLAIQTKPAGSMGGGEKKASKEEVKSIVDKMMN